MQLFQNSPILVDAYKHVLKLLQTVKHYQYHNIGHTLDVFRRARELCDAEQVTEEEQVDVLLAALFHDTGFVESYGNNEIIGVRIAKDWLTEKWHPPERIERVGKLILATIPFTKTESLLEQIIQDADLDNFGRDDCFLKMEKVEAELRDMTHLDTVQIYNIFSRLHNEYRFQTPTAVRERQAKKLRNRIRFERIYQSILQLNRRLCLVDQGNTVAA